MRSIKVNNYIYNTPEAINEWTERALLRFDVLQEKLLRFEEDKERELRLKYSNCKTCYYLMGDRIAGQAFTKYICRVCEKEGLYPNTAVPKICAICSDSLHICCDCGADLDFKKRKIKGQNAKRTK